MALLDRLINPLWHKIDSLEIGQKCVVAAVLNIHGFFRGAIDDTLVKPFAKLCSESESPAFRIGSQRIVPLSPTNRERLVDEALVAFLCACRRSNLPEISQSMNSSLVPDAVGCLALAEINSRLGRTKPESLDQTDYSRDPEEARTQLLLKWMEILNLRDTNFVGVVTTAFFAQEWEKCTEALVSGAFRAVMRSPSAMFTRARTDCSALSPRGRTVIEYLVKRARHGAPLLNSNDGAESDQSAGDEHALRTPDVKSRLRELSRISDTDRLALIAISDPSATVRMRAHQAMGIDVDSMLAKVITRVADVESADIGMCSVMASSLGWSVVPALKMLYDDHTNPKVRHFASLALGRFEEGYMGTPPSEP